MFLTLAPVSCVSKARERQQLTPSAFPGDKWGSARLCDLLLMDLW